METDASTVGVTESVTLLDRILHRAARHLGDLQPVVMPAYYRRFPEARAMFEAHGLDQCHKLEGEMIAETLFALSTWIERPVEIAIVLQSTVPHHVDGLHVPMACFTGFIDAVLDAIAGTVPADAADEQALLARIRQGLHQSSAEAARFLA